MKMFLRSQDWILNATVLFLIAAGLLSLRSVAPDFFPPQLSWFLLGLLAAFLIARVDLRPIVNYRWAVAGFYWLSIFLLGATLFMPQIRNAHSWLVFGPIQFQTSELMKVALIVFYASFFSREHARIAHIGNLLRSFVVFLIPAFLIFRQPDLGNTAILFFIWAGFLFVSGIRWRHLVIGAIALLIFGAVGWQYFLEDYQQDRRPLYHQTLQCR